MKKFKVTGWVYTISYEYQYCPVCVRHEIVIKANDEGHARYKFCFKVFNGEVHKVTVMPFKSF